VRVLLFELVEAMFPVLRRHSDFSIQFHHVSHLVLKPEQFLFKVFDLLLQIFHRQFSVLHHVLKFVYLAFEILNFTLEILIDSINVVFLVV
jgi:hypothetical protein